ncbi:MAG: histidinol-phosphate transaminase [Bacteroidota bacterium]
MEIDIYSLLRPNIRDLQPYSSARDEFSGKEGVFLDANENSWGSVTEQTFNRYPDPLQWKVKDRIAQLEGLSPQEIFLGNGSDEVIDLMMRAFCEPGEDQIIVLPPTYGMYKVSASIQNVALESVQLKADLQIDKEKLWPLLTKKHKLLFICSPNNPTGHLIQEEDTREVLEHFPGIVIIDEAYIDFIPEASKVSWIRNYPNLVVMKTFSKAWGLAGLRLGMGFAQKEIIEVLNRIKPPYNINSLTQEAAWQALEQPQKKATLVAEIVAAREKLRQALGQLELVQKIFPSVTNFLLVQFPNADALYDYLIHRKVIVRNRSRVALCDNCLRITVGTPPENQALIEALEAFSG